MNLAFRTAVEGSDDKPKLPGSLHVNRRLDRWLSIHADGVVTIRPGKVELGQGILTALAQISADELDVALGRIRVQAAATPDSPDEAVTSGSLSVQECGVALRHACADARRIFTSVTAQRRGVAVEDIAVRDGTFVAPDGRVLGSYWTMADDALLAVEASPEAKPKAAQDRRIAGTSAARIDLPDKLFGVPRYIHDLRLPGMLHARMVRPLDVKDGALPGGATVFRDGGVLAVVAEHEHHAEAAAERLARRTTWEERDTLPDDAALETWLRAAPRESSVVTETTAETPAPAHRVKAAFFRPFLAHASIGTSCAVARWDGAAMEVWSHSQGIYNLRADLSKALRLPPEQILVRHVEAAGCYGHNGADDVALDAALVARAHPGQPVRVQWSRAEELGWSPFSPAMLVEIEAEADQGGTLLRWSQEAMSNGHSSRPGRGKDPTLLSAAYLAEPFPVPLAINPPALAGGGIQRNAVPPYRTPALRVGIHRLLEMPIRASALRGLGALVNVWAIESVMDELAGLAGEDPLAHRLRHLDDARSRDVLSRAAQMAGWATRLRQDGTGFGLGVSRYKGTGAWCAAVAEVECTDRVRCRRVWLATDVGEVINSDGVANQMEGGAIQAVSMCLMEAVRHDARTITSDTWDRYPILRFNEVPEVAVEIIARPEAPPLGAGEASMGPVIAAIANGIADALGVRVRHWPFTPDNIAKA
jgi:CO/xanthine dehydrogenase Mo-binding subunit